MPILQLLGDEFKLSVDWDGKDEAHLTHASVLNPHLLPDGSYDLDLSDLGQFEVTQDLSDRDLSDLCQFAGITAIDDKVFRNRPCLRSVKLPDSLRKLGNHVFQNCERLEKVILPDRLEEIGDDVWEGCWVIRRLVLSAGISNFSEFAFRGAFISRIEMSSGSIRLPESLALSLEDVAGPGVLFCIPEASFPNFRRIHHLVPPAGSSKDIEKAHKGVALLICLIMGRLRAEALDAIGEGSTPQLPVLPFDAWESIAILLELARTESVERFVPVDSVDDEAGSARFNPVLKGSSRFRNRLVEYATFFSANKWKGSVDPAPGPAAAMPS